MIRNTFKAGLMTVMVFFGMSGLSCQGTDNPFNINENSIPPSKVLYNTQTQEDNFSSVGVSSRFSNRGTHDQTDMKCLNYGSGTSRFAIALGIVAGLLVPAEAQYFAQLSTCIINRTCTPLNQINPYPIFLAECLPNCTFGTYGPSSFSSLEQCMNTCPAGIYVDGIHTFGWSGCGKFSCSESPMNSSSPFMAAPTTATSGSREGAMREKAIFGVTGLLALSTLAS